MPVTEFDALAAVRPEPSVIAWSRGGRLPFGAPAGSPARDMRDELRALLPELQAQPGQVLEATFISDVFRGERVDLENVLLYDLESAAALAPSCRYGLRLERVFTSPTSSDHPRAEHLHHYTLAHADAGFRSWTEFRRLAEWDWVEIPSWSATRTFVSEIWWRLRHADEVRLLADPSPHPPSAFFIRLDLEGSAKKRRGPGQEGDRCSRSRLPVPTGRRGRPPWSELASQLGERPGVIEGALSSDDRAVLGAKSPLVVERAGSVQWHPSDHLIVALELTLNERVAPSWRMQARSPT